MSDPDKPRYRRVVRRHRSADPKRPSLRPAELWAMLKSYFGFGRVAPLERIESPEALGSFIDTRSSFMAQTSLYGYLRTRAGMRYPELFDDDPFVEGINIAKWHVWLDCLSDLAVYSGSRLAQHSPRDVPRVAAMMAALVEGILEAQGGAGRGRRRVSRARPAGARAGGADRLAGGRRRRGGVHREPGRAGALGAGDGHAQGTGRRDRPQFGALPLAGGAARPRPAP
jgi:hypothetical protein